MNKKDEIKEELREHSPFLFKMKEKEEAFKVPVDYFKSLPDEVLSRVNVESPERLNSIPTLWDQFLQHIQWLMQPRPVMAIASIALLIAVGVALLRPGATEADSSVQWADISAEEINQYVSSNIEEFDTDLLLQHSALDPDWELNPELDLDEEELDLLIDEIIDDLLLEDIQKLL